MTTPQPGIADNATAAVTEPTSMERREEFATWRAAVEARLDAGSEKMRALGEDLKANTIATLQVREDTSEVVSLLRSLQGAFRVFNMIGKLAKPLAAIIGLVAAGMGLYYTLKNGAPPVPVAPVVVKP